MKRASSTYRLQMIKEVAIRNQQQPVDDPMASHIRQMLAEDPSKDQKMEDQNRFIGVHFDENAGGWVDDRWSLK
ncbi:hypothetical protein [Vibrio nigripulchritudo]|uniref:hypothetical protein n=1 Tax=Vibrio nigripulchritudo TaxID=28173 RepID=UPI002491E909|nr:hypothetical protein [Vibrio nigripulchritudo]BDU40319.1 hypothetical protein TUMSATVNIG2_47880 [Vibrio nigripulchritudo]BDU46054.1 hypothetical protein TUMSATVNIG3_48520 [Vibrio nigripulchritudo]